MYISDGVKNSELEKIGRDMTMMISEAMHKKLDEQVGNEFFASHSYLAMACAFEDMGLKVFAKRFYLQADEERGHALKIVKYLIDVDARALLAAIPAPKTRFESAEEILEDALKHELKVTSQINDLMALAEKDKDYATRSFLQWYVTEQVEEVANIREILALAKMAGPKQMLQLESRIYRMMSSSS